MIKNLLLGLVMEHSQVLKNRRDRLPESKAFGQQMHMQLKRPAQMLGASKTLQKSAHAGSFVEAGKLMNSQGGYLLSEYCLCLPMQACRKIHGPLPTRPSTCPPPHANYVPHCQTPVSVLLSSSSFASLLLPLLLSAIFLVRFLVQGDLLWQTSSFLSHMRQMWSLQSEPPDPNG